MDINKMFKRKYHLKYTILSLIILLYFWLIGSIITQYVYKNYSVFFFGIFIVQFLLVVVMNLLYEKKCSLPKIESIEILKAYLKYFSEEELSYLEFTETITWFYRMIHTSYVERKEKTEDFTLIMNQLHYIMRPENNSTNCAVIKFPKGFADLTSQILYEIEQNPSGFSKRDFTSINLADNDTKYYLINWIHDKNIIIYALIIPVHIFGCILLASGSAFSWKSFLGNLCLYIPADICVILLYNGIIRQTKEFTSNENANQREKRV